LSDIESVILNLAGSLGEPSLNTEVATLRNRLSTIKTQARVGADQLHTVQSLWNQLEKLEQWNETKTAEMKEFECISHEQLSTIVGELQVSLLCRLICSK
jgi:hypothetical protein